MGSEPRGCGGARAGDVTLRQYDKVVHSSQTRVDEEDQ
jgi:hypothetical protein